MKGQATNLMPLTGAVLVGLSLGLLTIGGLKTGTLRISHDRQVICRELASTSINIQINDTWLSWARCQPS